MSVKFNKAVIFYNEHKAESVRWTEQIKRLLKSKNISARAASCNKTKTFTKKYDIAVAVGGDGTILQAARILAGSNIPFLGINCGSLGFLSVFDVKEFYLNINEILKENFKLQERFLIQVEMFDKNKRIMGPQLAFNDCVIKAAEPRAFFLKAKYGKNFLKTYFGDGLIISTPSGSTAYSLAASGPIVHPQLNVFVLTPICPHALTQRPLVLPADDLISVIFKDGHGAFEFNPIISLDGQKNFKLKAGYEVLISKSKKSVNFILPKKYDYFKALSRKLKWGER